MSKLTYKSGKNKKVKTDEKDVLILKELLKNARISYAALSEKTKIQRDTIGKRIEKLKRDGLIMGYETWLDPFVLGYNFLSHVFIKLEPVGEEDSKKFIQKLIEMPNITHITTILGNYDLVLTIVATDAGDFEEIVGKIKNNPSKVISSLDVSIITGDPKMNDLSGLL